MDAWIHELALITTIRTATSTTATVRPARTATSSTTSQLAVLTLPSGVRISNLIMARSRPDPYASEPMRVLRTMGHEAVPYLIKTLKQKDSFLARAYRQNHGRLTLRLREVLPMPGLSAPELHSAAALALGELSPEAVPMAPELIRMHREGNATLRATLLPILSRIARADPAIRPLLLDLLRPGLAPEETVKLISTLDLRGPKAAEALATAFQSSRSEKHYPILYLLSQMGQMPPWPCPSSSIFCRTPTVNTATWRRAFWNSSVRGRSLPSLS